MNLTRSVVGTLALAGGLALATSASADRILIDLGGGARKASGQWDTFNSATAPPPPSTVGELWWNAQTVANPEIDADPNTSALIPDLIRASDGASTGISLNMTAPFNGSRVEVFSLDPSMAGLQYTPAAFTDSLFIQTGSAQEVAQFTLGGLDASGVTTYDFTFYAARNNVSDNREGQYDVVGGNGLHTVTLNPSNNVTTTVTASGVTADSNGEIVINFSVGPNSESAYAYWNLLDIQYTPSQAIAGDLDSDGFVGITDLNIVLGAWNQNVTAGDLGQGDPSGDGFVGIEDLNAVLGNWNAGTPPAADTSVVPEPASLGLLFAGSLAVVTRRRK